MIRTHIPPRSGLVADERFIWFRNSELITVNDYA